MGVKFGFLPHWQDSLWIFQNKAMRRNLELEEKNDRENCMMTSFII
jgi:inactivated superfamily I helicase